LYEFVPAEYDLRADSETLAAHELTPGREYHVIISHVGGLYRYAVGDVARVLDVGMGAPRLAYAGRNRALMLGGTAVRESQLVGAASEALARSRQRARAIVASVQDDGNLLCAAVELADARSEVEWSHVSRMLESALGSFATAHTYRVKIDRLPRGTIFKDWCSRVESGLRPAQVKDRVLVDPAVYRELVADPRSTQARCG
jgi:hypothetical protein